MSRLPLRSWERDSRDGAGCLVILGLLGLLPLLLIGWWFGLEIRSNVQSAFNSIQWGSFTSFWKSWQYLIRNGSGSGNFAPLTFLIIGVYIGLLWQWIAYVLGWRTVFAPRRLWALSSWYFVAVILVLSLLSYQMEGSKSATSDNSVYNRWSWLFLAMCFSIIPATFLSITLPLWLSTPRTRREPSDTRARSK